MKASTIALSIHWNTDTGPLSVLQRAGWRSGGESCSQPVGTNSAHHYRRICKCSSSASVIQNAFRRVAKQRTKTPRLWRIHSRTDARISTRQASITVHVYGAGSPTRSNVRVRVCPEKIRRQVIVRHERRARSHARLFINKHTHARTRTVAHK